MIPVAVAAPVAVRDHAEHHTLRELYSDYYHAVRRRHGRRAPGRNIRARGVKTTHGVRTATSRELARSIRTFRRWLHPAPAPITATPIGVVASAPQPVTSTAGLPACAAESGTNYSTGPANTNPSTGATGRWQEMPMHRQRGGLCYGLSLAPSGQDACAVRIFKAQGSGAWVGCG